MDINAETKNILYGVDIDELSQRLSRMIESDTDPESKAQPVWSHCKDLIDEIAQGGRK